jgi:hypothetical protein
MEGIFPEKKEEEVARSSETSVIFLLILNDSTPRMLK